MKNQISEKSKAGIKSAQRETLLEKPSRSRVRVPMPASLARAIRAKAKRENITVSQLAARALRRQVASDRAAARPVTIKAQAAESEIPETWKEVAFIDFSGYLDRDCEERTIYKTPEGDLVARTSDQGKVFNEDVTREQVTRWLLECVIPEEFAKDFAIRSPKIEIASQNGVNRGAFADQRVRDALDDATFRGAALLEALSALLEFTEKADHPQLSDSTVEGLRFIAFKEGVNLRDCFENYTKLVATRARGLAA